MLFGEFCSVREVMVRCLKALSQVLRTLTLGSGHALLNEKQGFLAFRYHGGISIYIVRGCIGARFPCGIAQREEQMTDGKVCLGSVFEGVLMMIAAVRRMRDLLADCHEMLVADLGSVSDDALYEAARDLSEIGEYAGELYDVVAIQLANNELTEIHVEEFGLSASAFWASTSAGNF